MNPETDKLAKTCCSMEWSRAEKSVEVRACAGGLRVLCAETVSKDAAGFPFNPNPKGKRKMKYDDLEHCAELASSILGLLRATGIAPGQYAAEIHGELDHVRGLFSGARLLVEEENHSERACKAVIDAEQRLARCLSNALETAETNLVVWKDAGAGKEVAHA